LRDLRQLDLRNECRWLEWWRFCSKEKLENELDSGWFASAKIWPASGFPWCGMIGYAQCDWLHP
jgi:hypothetical protein